MYLTLYRKYRPKKFSDIVGQEHIIKTLKNQIQLNRVAHSYLFTGGRGTGKTTVAKIFAKAINCQEPMEDGSPCGHCTVCKEIESTAGINVIELDAASHNGVDDIRQIKEDVRYTPAFGKYKVYIIDEVHMLSTSAFNAMLKTLEEPPAYVVFILATTDPQKIPATVLSRCQRFDFRRIKTVDIFSSLKDYMTKENIDIENKALEYIARLADGGMRDALSILEQCISFYVNEQITFDKILDLIGAVDNNFIFELMYSIMAFDVGKALKVCEQINYQGRNIKQFVKDLLLHGRNLLIAKSTNNDTSGILDYNSEHILQLQRQAEQLTIESIFRYVNIFTQLDLEMKSSTTPKITLEIAIIKLCTPETDLSQNAIYDRIDALEKELENVKKNGIRVMETNNLSQSAPKSPAEVLNLAKASSEEYQNFLGVWNEIVSNMSQMLSSLFRNGTMDMYIKDEVIYIMDTSSEKNVSDTRDPFAKSYLQDIKEAIARVTKKEFKVQNTARAAYVSNNISLKEIENKINFKVIDMDY
ncbi:MAG: DNA polymerase III subunit gamma/tau [Candidatus Epulonipiscioides saccharophilum]|nr:MAG: DNA polymerase III subunit gamma/tau [Epulopiscium sp. AS2M-Bin001]